MISAQYVQSVINKGTRADGRKFNEYRNVEIEYGISSKSAEGSARVKIGNTEVIAGIKLDLGTPFPDKPDEGSIMVNVEMLPLSSTLFESGPPGIDAIEMSRVTDRAIRECKAINFKKLCVVEGEKVWLIFIDIYPINADGNLFDACALAAMAALKDTKFPKLLEGNKIDYTTKTKNSLPVEKLPISCTVWKIGHEFIVDPTVAEENASNSRLTIAYTEKDEICAMQKGGVEPLTAEEISTIVDIGSETAKMLRGKFK
ncbi:MAG: exosome complex protein Rrp42 [Nanoarchaeota archaeon]|nr:exosome complex protein Rrp42 [Nanoarchaeota archaeon]